MKRKQLHFFNYLIVIVALLNCSKPTKTGELLSDDSFSAYSKSNIDIDSLIKNHDDSILFLSFWSGMSKDEFIEILKREIERGNLINYDSSDVFRGKYGEFNIQVTNHSIKADFQASFDSTNHLEYTGLRIKMDYYVDYIDDKGLKKVRGFINPSTAREILNLYKNKYGTPTITEEPRPFSTKVHQWEAANKVIMISSKQDFAEKILDEHLYTYLHVRYLSKLKFEEENKKALKREQNKQRELLKKQNQI